MVDLHMVYGILTHDDLTAERPSISKDDLLKAGLVLLNYANNEGYEDDNWILGIKESHGFRAYNQTFEINEESLETEPEWDKVLRDFCEKYKIKYKRSDGFTVDPDIGWVVAVDRW